MTQTGETGYNSTLALPLSATATTMTVATAPTITKGAIKLGRGVLEERVTFTGNPTPGGSNVTLTGLTRGLSKTAIPATAGTGLSWIAGTPIKIVFMHDQLDDRKEDATIPGSKTFSETVNLTKGVGSTVYASTAARDSALGADGAATKAYTAIQAGGNFYNYNTVTAQREIQSTGTATPNASETVAGKVEEATQTQVEVGTDTGETGARTFIVPSKINPNTITAATVVVTDKFSFSDASDSNKLKSATIQGIIDLVNAKFGGTSADGVQGDANLTITGSNNTYIVKNFSSWTAGSVTRTCTVTPTGCIVHIKIRGNADFTNWTFDFSGKGAAGGAGGGQNVAGTAGTATTQILSLTSTAGGGGPTTGTLGGGGGASWTTNGSAAGGSGGTKGSIYALSSIQGRRCIEIGCGAGGGGGGGFNSGGAQGGTGGAGGGCLIIEVLGNFTLDNSNTVINCNGVTGGNAVGNAGGGGGGGGGSVYIMYSGTLTGTCTPTVAAGSGGTGGSAAAGGAGSQLIESNVVFT